MTIGHIICMIVNPRFTAKDEAWHSQKSIFQWNDPNTGNLCKAIEHYIIIIFGYISTQRDYVSGDYTILGRICVIDN